jgi:hypothetical protein
MSNDDYLTAAQHREQQLLTELAAANADLEASRLNWRNGDHSALDDMARAEQQIADIGTARTNMQSLVQQYVASRQPAQRYVSQEQRQARQANEMDAQDLADVMNTSRYRGRGFTADDYNRLRSGLPLYRATRGTETK